MCVAAAEGCVGVCLEGVGFVMDSYGLRGPASYALDLNWEGVLRALCGLGELSLEDKAGLGEESRGRTAREAVGESCRDHDG